MEYYNLQSQKEFESFYRDKVNQLLLRPDVISYLDKKKVYLNGQMEVNLFSNYDRKKFMNLTKFNNRRSLNSDHFSNASAKAKANDTSVELEILKDLNKLERNIALINDTISKDIVLQIANYEDKKRTIRKRLNKKTLLAGSQYISNFTDDNEMQRRRISYNNLMVNEIEEYIERNMNEMYKALDELKESYEKEINEAEESGYPGISNGLKEDLEVELDNLKLLYEEQRIKQTESIREKYFKK